MRVSVPAWRVEEVMRRAILAAALTMMGVTAAAGLQEPAASVADTWRAVLASAGGELPFTLRIRADANGLSAFAVNGTEEARFDSASLEGRTLRLRLEVYDSEIAALLSADGQTLSGTWTKGTRPPLAFRATRGDARRFLSQPDSKEAAPGSIAGAWAATFGTGEKAEAGRGEFTVEGERVRGTFLTPVGDHRYLEGDFFGGQLRLSRFDGSAASLYLAELQPDGSLSGQLWRGATPTPWTARRVDVASSDGLPDSFALAGLANSLGRLRFSFPDLAGQPVSLDDARFRGRVVLVNIFGSWCPNCNDEGPLLREWQRRYAGRGLEIVGLAYEQTGDRQGDRRAVQKFARRYGLEYPLLLAGISDRKAAAATLPDLAGLFAFPTNILVDRQGRVRKIHSGFAGPATGEHHRRLVAELERLIEGLLAETAAALEPAAATAQAR
jgi:thiol-disulfide isomerase/thioredoxin